MSWSKEGQTFWTFTFSKTSIDKHTMAEIHYFLRNEQNNPDPSSSKARKASSTSKYSSVSDSVTWCQSNETFFFFIGKVGLLASKAA